MRQIVLDTETSGLEVHQGHRIVEIGCVELVDRRITGQTYQQYLNPGREIDSGAMEVHGITDQFVADKPGFEQVAEAFLAFVDGADLIMHNAAFDAEFINAELARLPGEQGPIENHCNIIDSLALARRKHPGQKVNLDALCARYGVNNAQRDFHGGLVDAQILAEVYLAMTGGQTDLSLGTAAGSVEVRRLSPDRPPLAVIRATEAEQAAHEKYMQRLSQARAGES